MPPDRLATNRWRQISLVLSACLLVVFVWQWSGYRLAPDWQLGATGPGIVFEYVRPAFQVGVNCIGSNLSFNIVNIDEPVPDEGWRYEIEVLKTSSDPMLATGTITIEQWEMIIIPVESNGQYLRLKVYDGPRQVINLVRKCPSGSY